MPLVRYRATRLLNCLLEGEVAAAECYKYAALAVKETDLARHLHELECSHRMRVLLLRERLQDLGIEEAGCSGLLGCFIRLAATIALLCGLNLGLFALKGLESYGRHRYRMLLPMLEQSQQEFVKTVIGKEQEICCDRAQKLLESRFKPDASDQSSLLRPQVPRAA